MNRPTLLLVTASRRWKIGTGALAAAMATLGVLAVSSGELRRPVEMLGGWMALIVPVLAVLEVLSRSYEFGSANVRYRDLLGWHERQIPLNLRMDLSIKNVITIKDADTGKLVVTITREYTRGGKLLEQLADFYRECDRCVDVTAGNSL